MEWEFTLDGIKKIAGAIWQLAGENKIFLLHGEMGSGKTTLIHALCEVKQVKDHVTSPTFVIINEYRYEEDGEIKKIFHLDLYRLNSEEEAIRAGIEDCIDSSNICFVEWPEKAPLLFPESSVHIYLNPIDSTTRRLKIQIPH